MVSTCVAWRLGVVHLHLPFLSLLICPTLSVMSATTNTVTANSPSAEVALFHNGVRTSAPPPRVGDFVQLKIRQDDIDHGPPSATNGATDDGSKTSIYTCVILSVNEDHVKGHWNPHVLLCRGFSHSTNPLEYVANMHPDDSRLLLPLPAAISSGPSTPAAFESPVRTDAYVSGRDTWIYARTITARMGQRGVSSSTFVFPFAMESCADIAGLLVSAVLTTWKHAVGRACPHHYIRL